MPLVARAGAGLDAAGAGALLLGGGDLECSGDDVLRLAGPLPGGDRDRDRIGECRLRDGRCTPPPGALASRLGGVIERDRERDGEGV